MAAIRRFIQKRIEHKKCDVTIGVCTTAKQRSVLSAEVCTLEARPREGVGIRNTHAPTQVLELAKTWRNDTIGPTQQFFQTETKNTTPQNSPMYPPRRPSRSTPTHHL